MKFSFTKSNIIQLLLILVVLLLAANIILEKLYKPGTSSEGKSLSSSVINERFLTSLRNYNMDSTWISSKDYKGDDDDSLKYGYKVKVPADLPVSLLIREVQGQFDTGLVVIHSIELKKDKSTELNISSGGYLKLKAVMIPDRDIIRSTDTIGFVLTGIGQLNNDELKSLLLMPEYFAGVLIPSKRSQELLKSLNENQKEAVIMLNDDISELEFKLNTGYSSRRIKNSVLSIIGKFYKAAFFVIDENSDIYSSAHLKLIRDEFSKRKMTLLRWDSFPELKHISSAGLISEIKELKRSSQVFKIPALDFLEMPPLLETLRKRGYKFARPSRLILKQQESR